MLGERQDFIKKFQSDVVEVAGRQIMLEKEQDNLREIDKQNDLKLNGQHVMIESLQFEMDQVKERHKELKRQL